MTGYIRTIRGIEKTSSYTPIQAASRYAAYPLPMFEQSKAINRQNWNSLYMEAAESAATWLQTAHQAQQTLGTILQELGRDEGIHAPTVLKTHAISLANLIQELDRTYKKHQTQLKPEIWGALELALRHPAMEALGLREQELPSLMQADTSKVRRLLLGTDGLLNDLKRALTYAEQRKPLDLLRLPFPSAYPYALYYGAMQTYWPLPLRGVIFNKYV